MGYYHILCQMNDGMGDYVANQVIKLMNKKGVLVKDARILLLGITFKENCPDIRNTKVIDIHQTLKEYTNNISVYDPWADKTYVKKSLDIDILTDGLDTMKGLYDAVILCVAHEQFKNILVRDFLYDKQNGVVYDVKGFLNKTDIDGRL